MKAKRLLKLAQVFEKVTNLPLGLSSKISQEVYDNLEKDEFSFMFGDDEYKIKFNKKDFEEGVVDISLMVKRSPENTFQKSFGLTERSQRLISELDPRMKPLAIKLIAEGLKAGLRPEIVEGKRTQERQNQLYEQGRTQKGPVVTWVKKSKHTQGLAIDIAMLDENNQITFDAPEEFWNKMGRIGKSIGLRWGGDWKQTPDKPHFEYP